MPSWSPFVVHSSCLQESKETNGETGFRAFRGLIVLLLCLQDVCLRMRSMPATGVRIALETDFAEFFP
jgi:hypothetical protein